MEMESKKKMMFLVGGGLLVVVVIVVVIVLATSGKKADSTSSGSSGPTTVVVNVTTPAPRSSLVKTILLEKADMTQPINIGEITLFDDANVKIPVSNITATIDPQHPDFGPANLLDNNPDTFGHTLNNGVTQYMKLVLTNPMKIKRIVIMNRTSCCQDRIATVAVRTLNANNDELSKNVLTGASLIYELSYDPSSGAYLNVVAS